MNKEVVAIIQARIGSTRLPGKVLKVVAGKPMLWHMVNRLRFSNKVNRIGLVTPNSASNDVLEHFAHELGLLCFRGHEDNVLSMYYGAAVEFGAQVIVRLTADCPLIDPRVTDSVIEAHLNSGADYTAGGMLVGDHIKHSFPLGLDTEVFNFRALERTYREANQIYEYEHVTPYIYQHPELFKLKFIGAVGKLRRPELRLTVDEENDLKLIREIFNRLYQEGQIFYTEDVIDLLDNHPELIAINTHVKQKKLGE